MSAGKERRGLPDWSAPMLLAILPLLGWWATGLFDVDEGFYGAITAEMNRRGEWLTPLYNGHPWFEKPILLYWLAKPCLMAFGHSIGPRLPSVLATIGVYALVLGFARRHLSWTAARFSLVALSTSLLFVAVGRMMLTDPILILCVTGAALSFWDSLVGNAKWRILTAFWLGLATLDKGPVGIALFTFAAIACFCLAPGLRPKFRGWWLLGTLVMLATIATWYVPAYLVDRQAFVQQFLVEQNLHRFSGGDRAHQVPFPLGLVYYVPALLLGMAPWSFLAWKSWPRREDFNVRTYQAVWATVVVVFFTISGAKLVHYVLPAFPFLAMLVGDYLARKPESSRASWTKFGLAWTLVVAVVANAGFWFAYRFTNAGLHDLAERVKGQPNVVAVYQMSRQDGSAAGMSAKLQETSHPSLLMILNRDVVDTDSLDVLLSQPLPVWIITRDERIGQKQVDLVAAAGDDLSMVRSEGGYALWKLR